MLLTSGKYWKTVNKINTKQNGNSTLNINQTLNYYIHLTEIVGK